MVKQHAPRISIVIPAFNREDYLSATITSCLHQSTPIDEIIVIDNHSTDKTSSIARNLERKHQQIRVIRNQKNIGMIANWNKGIKATKHEYVAVLHSDDLLPYHWCEQIKKAISLNFKVPPRLYFGTVVYVRESNQNIKTIAKIKTFQTNQYFKPKESISKLWRNFYGNPGCSAAVVYHKSIFELIGYFNPDHSTEADQEFHLRVLNKFPSYHLNQDLVYYRLHQLQGYDLKRETGSDDRSIDRILNSLKIQSANLDDKSLIAYNSCGALLYYLQFVLSGKTKHAKRLFIGAKKYMPIITFIQFPSFLFSLLIRRWFSRYQ